MARITVERDVGVETRDGTELATDVYRPDDDGTHPALLLRSPYGKSHVGETMFRPVEAAEHGYAVVVQDIRGRLNSEGDWEPFVNEREDGYDAVEWTAEQDWCDGNVGVVGTSYLGVTAMSAVVADPPHLECALVGFTAGDLHDGWVYSGGAFELGFNLMFGTNLSWDALGKADLSSEDIGAAKRALMAAASDPEAAAETLPLTDIPLFDSGVAPYWQEWLDHPSYDDYWEGIDLAASADSVDVPVLHVTGWYDVFARGEFDLYDAIASEATDEARANQHLVVGPWDHEAPMSITMSKVGDREFGPRAVSGPAILNSEAFEWLDAWLVEGEAPDIPGVRYFDVGAESWETADAWPPDPDSTAWYLDSGGAANSRHGDGRLVETPGEGPPDSYEYDPADPVPSRGGRTLMASIQDGGITDQSGVEERDDVLVYTSPRLTEPLTVAGPVTSTLYVASSAPDTDFTAKLVDVDPDGYCANVAEGIKRARYRESETEPTFMEPGETVEVPVELGHVAHTFEPGHRVRLEVSSSNFPKYDRNCNVETTPAVADAEEMQVATQQVFHDADHPSRLSLPVVE
ncbi:CocE/NonD family hydrolase [Halorarius halobius]|uniref:CocE/NonD family hydrolase n=1 Tax=Halorarius halobius TaxID=2962671 RepID=UPI0020CD5AAE|nr:CocE/NonD family hydrolase [Halorarius halobius]